MSDKYSGVKVLKSIKGKYSCKINAGYLYVKTGNKVLWKRGLKTHSHESDKNIRLDFVTCVFVTVAVTHSLSLAARLAMHQVVILLTLFGSQI